MTIGQMVGDNWIGGWQLVDDNWLVTSGWWQLVGGNWWVAIGWWQLVGDNWLVAEGRADTRLKTKTPHVNAGKNVGLTARWHMETR